MSKDNEYKRYEKIEDFVEGRLIPEELERFKAEMAKDAVLAEEVNIYKNLPKIFEEEEYQEEVQNLLETLNKIKMPVYDNVVQMRPNKKNEGVEKKTNTANQRRMLYVLAVAATVILLIFVAQPFFFPNASTAPEKIYAQYAQHNTLDLISKSGTTNELTVNLEKAFNEQDYQKALTLSQTYLQSNSTAYDVLLAKAIAELELGNYEAALSTLTQLRQSDVRINQADWYTALTYLKMQDTAAAQKVLNQIVADKSFNYQKAQKILEVL